jgi:hypothetical protein
LLKKTIAVLFILLGVILILRDWIKIIKWSHLWIVAAKNISSYIFGPA